VKTRQDAWTILTEFTKGDVLLKHALAVEAAMRAYARRYGEDEEQWAVTALVHDLDFEQHPTAAEHPEVGARILEERGWPAEIVRAVRSHAQYLGVPRLSNREKALFAVDELTGLVIAVALVRPSKSILDVEVKSVKKKWKDSAFARGVSRQDIELGAGELGIPLEEHIQVVIDALRSAAEPLGLVGHPGAGQ
jgi:putative nucleotidyltransferase with HDIG domain